jgi:hypothetical protein
MAFCLPRFILDSQLFNAKKDHIARQQWQVMENIHESTRQKNLIHDTTSISLRQQLYILMGFVLIKAREKKRFCFYYHGMLIQLFLCKYLFLVKIYLLVTSASCV